MNQLKAWLIPNLLTENKADFLTISIPSGSMDIREIITEMVEEGMELQPETGKNTIKRFNRKTTKFLA